MSVPVLVTPAARDDVRQAEDYYERLRTGLGSAFVHDALTTFTLIGDMPLGFAEIGLGLRAVVMSQFGYVVYYRFDGVTAEVVAVLYGGRSPRTWRSRA